MELVNAARRMANGLVAWRRPPAPHGLDFWEAEASRCATLLADTSELSFRDGSLFLLLIAAAIDADDLRGDWFDDEARQRWGIPNAGRPKHSLYRILPDEPTINRLAILQGN
jgi:hypothetical protein